MGCNRTTLARPWSVHLLIINVNDARISGSLSRTLVTDIVSVFFSMCFCLSLRLLSKNTDNKVLCMKEIMLVIYPLMERKYTTFSLTVSHPEA